ncbi:MAG TPA: hypothetical protein VI382_07730 [Candidatus Manganitrophaceae bacterium]|nr:hypothetical protein [Candidatus Manganitrophaceae bacterium]
MKKQIVATFFSAVLPGAGQIYDHKWAKGFGFLAAAMILSGIARRARMGGSSLLQWIPSPAGIYLVHIALLGLAFWSAFDMYRSSQKKR